MTLDVKWCKEKGVIVLSNLSRSEKRLDKILSDEGQLHYVSLGSVKGNLKQNIDEVLIKLSTAAMISLANHIIEMGPIVPNSSKVQRTKKNGISACIG
jgi:hypothetical protein